MAFRLRTRTQTGILLTFILALSLIYPLHADTAGNMRRSDLVHIRLRKPPGGFKMPQVVFAHDMHTEALDKDSCKTCHLQKESDFSFKFNRLEDQGFDKDKDLYHAHCIGCHEDLRNQGKNAGPQTGQCRMCHKKTSLYIDISHPFGMDKSLHYRHTQSEAIFRKDHPNKQKDENCGACHHEYDKTLKKTVYVKGKEETCRYCHKPEKTEEASSFQNAAHDACINCHLKLNLRKIKAGPIDCAGCHDVSRQMKIEKIEEVPRIKRNQPDAVLLSTWLNDALASGKPSPQFVSGVAFNHLSHENLIDHCWSCHHSSLDKCTTCHTRTGDPKGGGVTLEQAMHSMNTSFSCAGCHQKEQKKPDCAGCHFQMMGSRCEDKNCADCHTVPRQSFDPLPANKEMAAQIAADEIKNHRFPKQIDQDQIPDKVSIDIMSKQYQGAMFPHRQIVLALYKRTEKNALASFFHNEPTSICHGCHHHSPSADSFPKCASCHEAFSQTNENVKPGLMGAYHGQCISCHQRMGLEKPSATDCTACHKKPETTATTK